MRVWPARNCWWLINRGFDHYMQEFVVSLGGAPGVGIGIGIGILVSVSAPGVAKCGISTDFCHQVPNSTPLKLVSFQNNLNASVLQKEDNKQNIQLIPEQLFIVIFGSQYPFFYSTCLSINFRPCACKG